MDVKEYLACHDLVYKSAPKIWADGLLCGNGDVGTVFFAPYFPEFLINKTDIWDYETVREELPTHKEVLKALAEGKELWELRPGKDRWGFWGEKMPAPKTGAKLRLRFGGSDAIGDMWAGAYRIENRLSLYDGVLRTAMDRHLSHPRVESFVHAGKNIFCLRANGISVLQNRLTRIEIMRPVDHAYEMPEFGSQGDAIWMKMRLPKGFHYIVAAKVVPVGTAAYLERVSEYCRAQLRTPISEGIAASIEPDRASLDVDGDFELFVSVVTSKESKTPLEDAVRLVESAATAGFSKLHREHARWWDAFWRKSYITLSDKVLEQIWYISLYMQASQYRKAPVPGLQGLFFGPSIGSTQQLAWGGNYTNDQNTEIVPMPFFTLNHPELVEPFYDTFNSMIPQAKRDTKRVFDMRGMHLPFNCGPDGKAVFCFLSYIHCAGPYHGLIYSWGWHCFRDKKMLKGKIYPFIKEVCNFFADYMTFNEQTGQYRLYPSQPAEFPSLDVGNPTHTLSLLKVTLKTAIEASETLGVDREDRKLWVHLLEHYPDYSMDKGIFVDGDTVPAEHRINQSGGLYPVFPCGEYDEDSAKDILKAAKKTYRSIGARQVLASYAQAKGWHFPCGWQVFFHTMQAMRLGFKRDAWRLLRQEWLRCFMKPNGLHTHNAVILADPEKSEANLDSIPDVTLLEGEERVPLRELIATDICQCTDNLEAKEQVFSCIEDSSIPLVIINEMLMQSHNGILRLFPACPPRWSAAFDGFLAPGAFLVSSSMQEGTVEFVTIKSLVGGTLKVKSPWPGKKVVVKTAETATHRSSACVELTLGGNETVSLYQKEADFLRAQQRAVTNTNTAQPKRLRFYDGSRAWLGKPKPSEYYAR